jgi:hypothetical protein
MERLEPKAMALTVGSLSAITFVLCVVYGLVVPAEFHASALLEAVLPGFRWLTLGSVVLGVVETFAYGAYLGLAYAVLRNFFAGRVRPAQANTLRRAA